MEKNEEYEKYKYFINGRDITIQQTKDAVLDIIKSGLTPETLEKSKIKIFNGDNTELSNKLGRTQFNNVSILGNYTLIEFPYFNEEGKEILWRYKIIPEDKENHIKYLHKHQQPALPYILPEIWSIKEKSHKPLWITEGEKKTISLIQNNKYAIGLSGVWNFKAGKNNPNKENGELLTDLQKFIWKGRSVYLGFDIDLWTNPQVRNALYELSFKLYSKNAIVKIATWLDKKGIDDYLQGKDKTELDKIENEAKDLLYFININHSEEIIRAIALNSFEPLQYSKIISKVVEKLGIKSRVFEKAIKLHKLKLKENHQEKEIKNEELLYKWDDNEGLMRLNRTKDGEIFYFKIANFMGKINKTIDLDNGKTSENHLLIKLKGIKDGKNYLSEVRIPSEKFLANINNVIKNFPEWAVIEPGQNTKDYIRHSIQIFSNEVSREKVYTHTGWVKDKDGFFYVTSNGAIGKENVTAEFDNSILNSYSLPTTPENEIEAIKASLSIIELGKEEITIPLWICIYLSVLTSIIKPTPDFLLYLSGKSGVFKTELGCLALAHFGDYYKIKKTKCGFRDTVNKIEKRGFDLKDTITLLDDFCPSISKFEAERMKQILHGLIRNYGNLNSRGRLNPDSSEKISYEPRGMIIITGEDSPEIESATARLLELEIKPNDIDIKKLSELQNKVNLLPHAMSSFINWLIPKLPHLEEKFSDNFIKLRNSILEKSIDSTHKRNIEHACFIITTSKILWNFLVEKKIFTKEEANEFIRKVENIFTLRTIKESQTLKELNEVELFYKTVEILFNQEKIYVFNLNTGSCTARFTYQGRVRNIETETIDIPDKADPRLKGEFVGWEDENFYYFNESILTVIYNYFSKDQFPISKRMLIRRLEDEKFLIPDNDGKHKKYKIVINDKGFRILKIIKRIPL